MCLTGRDNKDRIKDLVLENGEVIEGVGQFCYLGDVLKVVQAWRQLRVRNGWKKFREVMRSGKSGGEIVKTGRWSCAVYAKGVGANSIQCTDCYGWVHKRCSGAIQSFRCRICLTDEKVRSE